MLVDSEPLANRVFAQMLTEIGLPTSADSALRDFMGRATSAVTAIVEARLDHSLPFSMGVEPEQAIVVEDSPRGVEAGVAAGMVVLAYADHVPSDELAAAGGLDLYRYGGPAEPRQRPSRTLVTRISERDRTAAAVCACRQSGRI